MSPPLEFKLTAAVVRVTVFEKVMLPAVVMFTPAMVAILATVNALLKLELAPENVTPIGKGGTDVVPLAVNVVIPTIFPPSNTPSTVIKPVAVMFKLRPAVMLAKSSLLTLKRVKFSTPSSTFIAGPPPIGTAVMLISRPTVIAPSILILLVVIVLPVVVAKKLSAAPAVVENATPVAALSQLP